MLTGFAMCNSNSAFEQTLAGHSNCAIEYASRRRIRHPMVNDIWTMAPPTGSCSSRLIQQMCISHAWRRGRIWRPGVTAGRTISDAKLPERDVLKRKPATRPLHPQPLHHPQPVPLGDDSGGDAPKAERGSQRDPCRASLTGMLMSADVTRTT